MGNPFNALVLPVTVNKSLFCAAASHRLGVGRVLPSRSGIQRQGGVALFQRPRAAGGLSGTTLTCASVPAHPRGFSQSVLSADVRLQSGHVEPRLHVGQHDFPEGAVFPRPGQLWPGKKLVIVVFVPVTRCSALVTTDLTPRKQINKKIPPLD